MDSPGYVYIMANKRNGTIYLGAAADLPKRVWEHKEGVNEGFTKKYGCKLLVWYERFENLHDARRREVQMKNWRRSWKLKRIEAMNPEWDDLYDTLA